MDLPLLPNSVSEYSREPTGIRFTVRSASSPSYNLTRRPGLRRAKASENVEEGANVEVSERESHRGEAQRHPLTQKQTDTSKEDSANSAKLEKTETTSMQNEKSKLKTSVQFSRKSAAGGVTSDSDSDRSGNCKSMAGGRGRTEWRRFDQPSRSKSVDWRGGAHSLNQGTGTGGLPYSGGPGEMPSKQTESLERRGPLEGTEGKVMSRIKSYNLAGSGNVGGKKSPVSRSPTGQTRPGFTTTTPDEEKTSWGQSLPTRLRRSSASDFALRETSSSIGSKAGQSIWERIEKLYGSAGFSQTDSSTKAKRLSAPIGDWPLSEVEAHRELTNRRKSTNDSTLLSPSSSPFSLSFSSPSSSHLRQRRESSNEVHTGGTFPRRFSKEEKNSPSVVQSDQANACPAQTDASSSVNPTGSVPSVLSGAREKATGGARQGLAQGRLPDEGEVRRGRGMLGEGTMSLDRIRSKFTVAAQIRASRAAATATTGQTQAQSVSGEAWPHSQLEEETVTLLRHPTGHREEGRNGGEETGAANNRLGKGGVDRMSKKVRKEGIGSLALKVENSGDPERMKPSEGEGMNEDDATKRSRVTEEVFEPSTQKVSLKITERRKLPGKLVVPSAASVRNKIHQYEALTQRAQRSATHPILMTRRAFSVPTQLSGASEGVKKSGSDRVLGGLRRRWDGLGEEGEVGNMRGEGMTEKVDRGEAKKEAQRDLYTVDEVGVKLGSRRGKLSDRAENRGKEDSGTSLDFDLHFTNLSTLRDKQEIPLNEGTKQRICTSFYIDETDFTKATSPESPSQRDITTGDTLPSLVLNSNNNSNGLLDTPAVQDTPISQTDVTISDEDTTPTNIPDNSPFLSQHPLPDGAATTADGDLENTRVFTGIATPEPNASSKERDSLQLPTPLTASSPTRLSDLGPPGLTIPQQEAPKRDEEVDAWMASLNRKIEDWSDDDDDDEGTEKDEDSNYDSDSGESSVTITSNMSSQSDRKSFCLSLADLCNIGGVEYDSENDNDDWWSGRRSASLSSDVSAISCVSVLASEELDRLLEDVRGLGDSTLQDYEDVQVVVLHKEVGVGLGFTVAGGVDQNKPITVHRVFSSGVAAQEGSIREGDRVLSINGTALCGSAHWEALRTLRRARTRGMGVVVLRRGGVSVPPKGGAGTNPQGQRQSRATELGERVCVRLEKRSRDLGFSLEGGVGSSLGDRPLSIQKIFLGGPASEVCPGDEVVEIEGVNVVGMRRLEAWTLIRSLPPGPVDVVLHRPFKPLEP